MEYTDNLELRLPASSDEYKVADFNYNFERIDTVVGNGKAAIAAAITDQGVDTSSSDSFTTMAENILALNTNSPNIIYKTETGTVVCCDTESYSPE